MLNATVVKRITVSRGLVILCVKPDEPVPDFIPGQYATLGIPGNAPRAEHFPPEEKPPHPDKLVKRPYSVASASDNKDHLEFYLAILPTGEFTSRLDLVREGDRLFLGPKLKGTFTLEAVPHGSNLIMVSTGTGIAPFISMLRSPGFWEQYKEVTLIHGIRYMTDFAYADELADLTKTKPFRYLSIVSRPEDNWTGEKGYVQDLIKRNIVTPAPSTDHVLLCGNPGMINDVSNLLIEKGYKEHHRREPGNLHIEKYW